MPETISMLALDVGVALLGVYLLRRYLTAKPGTLPPGPKPLPLIGNLLDMPKQYEHETFAEWGKKYGGIVSINVLGQSIIILNSTQAVTDMLDKKSAIYSDRPNLVMGSELVGLKNLLGMSAYGDQFREYRRMLFRVMGSRAAMAKYYSVEELETHRFLRRVAADPDNLEDHIRKTAGAIILSIGYGYSIKEKNDEFVEDAQVMMEDFARLTEPGAFLVDTLPALRHLPEGFPGAGFKTQAKEYSRNLLGVVNKPYEWVKKQVEAGTAQPSFVLSHWDEAQADPKKEYYVKWAAAALFAGGADTTVSTIYSFYLAMTLHPEIQKKAQAEIDAVVGPDRLPNFSDRANLPYVDAIVKEIARWHPVAPIGLPHRLMEDDVQDGYLIPKGSIVIANIWKFLHDPETYKNPFDFVPERFIKTETHTPEADPYLWSFGFGRRICPGLNLADASIYISIAMTLAAFDITKARDASGNEITPPGDYLPSIVSHAAPFKCSIKPRSEKAAALISSVNVMEE
ncbi:hypothetical protein EVG20_g545 [Dentipellis fragilis]|uniref:Cytochrome P450 n=1 Tax=Dentipellis fragilis TaxID=205917 RepID=A0A4Y9ZFB2_9AGAM|nr:hypothetical protein EVG20_g545 [Dentipellis fragilis]